MPGQAKAAPNRAARRARKQHLDRLHRRADRAGARVFKAALSSGRLGELSQDAQEDDDDTVTVSVDLEDGTVTESRPAAS